MQSFSLLYCYVVSFKTNGHFPGLAKCIVIAGVDECAFHKCQPTIPQMYMAATAKYILNVLSQVYHYNNKLFGDSEVIQKLLLTLKEQFLITADEVEEWVDTAEYLEENELSCAGGSEEERSSSVGGSEEELSSSVGGSEEDGSSSVGDSEEEEIDPRMQQEVGEIAQSACICG